MKDAELTRPQVEPKRWWRALIAATIFTGSPCGCCWVPNKYQDMVSGRKYPLNAV